MPINPAAIDAFLHRREPWVPAFKHADPEWLQATIFDVTGKPYKPRTQPRAHQLEGIAFALYQRRALLYYSPRLGKTLMSLQWAEQLRRGGQWRGKGIVICHAPIGLSVWESEAEKHCNLSVYPVRNQFDELLAGLESDADLLLIPWTGLQSIFTELRKTKKGKNKLYVNHEMVRMAAEAFSLCIIDEIHGAKSHDSLRFKIAKELIQHCPCRIGLTGTPFGRNPFDVWAQAYLIDDGKTLGFNFQFFQACFGVRKHNWFSGQPEYKFDDKKKQILESKLASITLPYKLEECQKVPLFPGTVDLHLSGDQFIAYEQCIKKLIEIPDHQAIEVRSMFTRLRQISSGFLPFSDEYGNVLVKNFKNNVKAEWLAELLDACGSDIPPMVIMHEFTATGQIICDVLAKADVKHHWLHGATKDKPRVVKDFQASKVDALVVQVATGGMAIDLCRADYMIIYESSASPIVRAQAEARPLSAARGDRPLLLDDLLASGVERKILEYVKAGKDLMTSIIHDRHSLRGGNDELPRSHRRGRSTAHAQQPGAAR